MSPVRRLTAILAADVAGYSRLMGADEEGTHERLKAHLREVVDPKIAKHHGRIVKNTGDGFLADFSSVVDAVRCAVEVQRGMAERNTGIPAEKRIEFRVGINLGDVIVETHDIFGDGVNIAARLEGLAEPGGICTSRVVRDQVRDKLSLLFEDMGERSVKNIARPVRVYRIVLEKRALSASGSERAGSEKTSDVSGPMGVRPLTNLPAQTTDLIGLDDEIGEVIGLVGGHRFVTLTGTGGIGKTRLALEVARHLLPQFADGVWIAELASRSDPQLVPVSVGAVLGLEVVSGVVSPRRIAAALGSRQVMLVLDNCEHVIDAAAEMVEAILHANPAARVITTSREPLRAEGEHLYRVPPLAVPADDTQTLEDVLKQSAVALFVARAQAADPHFLPNTRTVLEIAAICRRLDGIPLAIELAAARASTLGVQELASRLDDRLSLLTEGLRTGLRRHQTLRATLDWSYELLSESERAVLRQLSIFTEGFTLAAASAVLTNDEMRASNVLEAVGSLVAKSLVTADLNGTSAHYRLLETTRAYAREKLAERGELEQAERKHAEYYQDLLRDLSRDILRGLRSDQFTEVMTRFPAWRLRT